ncbi:hypothetical protein [Fictibacillus terranigra]|uniref:Uncharacterized protein n=1 Tax=Fictibacillus terranigra TaxID=3058424 RepID=A0ABT8E299_9BACL|nr:hypothetical protein [Fictibacillus sp. CENA-BCM004]MDN4072044.1 hypothetical protein [Fictibacillus sp. CENA-BCM004]
MDASTSLKALTFIVGPVSLMSLRHKVPKLERPFLLRAAKIVTPLAFVGATLVIYWSKWKVVSFIIPITILSLILYFVFAYREPSHTKEIVKLHLKSGWWLIIYYLFLLAMSYAGSYGPGAKTDHLIHAPWDTLVAGLSPILLLGRTCRA